MAIPQNVKPASIGLRLSAYEWERHRSTGNKGTTLQLQASIDGFLLGSGEEAPKATEVCIVEGGDGINYVCQ